MPKDKGIGGADTIRKVLIGAELSEEELQEFRALLPLATIRKQRHVEWVHKHVTVLCSFLSRFTRLASLIGDKTERAPRSRPPRSPQTKGLSLDS